MVPRFNFKSRGFHAGCISVFESALRTHVLCKTSEEEEIKADFRRLDGYVFTYEGQDAETKAQRELSAALDAGLKNVTLVGIFSFKDWTSVCSLYFKSQGVRCLADAY